MIEAPWKRVSIPQKSNEKSAIQGPFWFRISNDQMKSNRKQFILWKRRNTSHSYDICRTTQNPKTLKPWNPKTLGSPLTLYVAAAEKLHTALQHLTPPTSINSHCPLLASAMLPRAIAAACLQPSPPPPPWQIRDQPEFYLNLPWVKHTRFRALYWLGAACVTFYFPEPTCSKIF